jgi:hypothetical protein
MPLVIAEELAASLADEVEKKYEKKSGGIPSRPFCSTGQQF